MSRRFLIIGAGFSGSVLARELVTKMDCHIDLWEGRDHLAGNCHTYEDSETGIMVHSYGPHIFNTDKQEIWDYVDRFSPLRPYVHKVVAVHGESTFRLPVNLDTLSRFFGLPFTPQSAEAYLRQQAVRFNHEPRNFEEQALSVVGKALYEAFFEGYTRKQWGCDPKMLPASVFSRLPVRYNRNDNYHNHQLTGIPENGYTHFVQKLLSHPRIHVTLNRRFHPATCDTSVYDHVFYTGPIDSYFDFAFGKLSYRTLTFEKRILRGTFQKTAQTNFCDEAVPYTRITEHKHFTPWKTFDKTIIFTEYSKEPTGDDVPYYPKRLPEDIAKLRLYEQKASLLPDTTFLGRLGLYRYLDMQHVIEDAMLLADNFVKQKER